MRKVIWKTFTSRMGNHVPLLCWPHERGELRFNRARSNYPEAPSRSEYYLYPMDAGNGRLSKMLTELEKGYYRRDA